MSTTTTTADQRPRTDTGEGDVQVGEVTQLPHGSRQRLVIDAAGATISTDTVLRDGVYEFVTTSFTGPGGEAKCEWEPALVVYELPISDGDGWHTDATCTVDKDGLRVERHSVIDSTIRGVEVVDVGGAAVTTWIIDRVEHSTTQGSYLTESWTSEEETRVTEWLASDLGLAVRQVRDTSWRTGNGDHGTSSTTLELLKVEPR